MTQFRVELLRGPAAQKGTIESPGDQPPAELPIKIESGPPIYTEETGPMAGVDTYAIYVLVEVDSDGVAIYGFSREQQVQ